jgi:hypothetical protein
MGKTYRDWVIEARDGFNDADRRAGATAALRAMVEEIVLTPEGNELGIVLKGDLAAMLAAAGPKSDAEDLRRQVTLVAGARSRQYRPLCTSWRHEHRPAGDVHYRAPSMTARATVHAAPRNHALNRRSPRASRPFNSETSGMRDRDRLRHQAAAVCRRRPGQPARCLRAREARVSAAADDPINRLARART